ncbi:MAG: SIS domain-containing protein [Thermoplasmatota archaeon]
MARPLQVTERAGRAAAKATIPRKARRDTPSLHDPQHFMDSIQSKARFLQDGYLVGTIAAPRRLKAKGLLLSGMGFSGMVANVVKDAATRAMEIPLTIVKHYQFPNHVQKGWHTLAITYSGDTEETLAVVRTSLERGVGVTGFSTGGKLAGMVDRIVAQPPGYQPRAAFGYTWFSLLGYLEASGVLDAKVPVAEAVAAVRGVDEACGPKVPEASNPAKQLARALWHPIPQVYATPAFYGVGLHFRGMLNENAKKIAKVDLVPESNHNDLTGWGGDKENRKHFAVVALRHGGQNPELQKRLAFMEERYRKWGVAWHNRVSAPIESFESHVVEQARAIQFFDYTSVYVAALRGEDPAEIREIKALKRLLREGRAD